MPMAQREDCVVRIESLRREIEEVRTERRRRLKLIMFGVAGVAENVEALAEAQEF